MEKSENIEANVFENFESQGKYISVSLEMQKKADKCATISMITLVLGCCLPFFYIKVCEPFIQGNNDMLKIIVLCVSGGMYLISLIMCIWGRIIMKTKNVKMMMAIHVLSVLGAIIGWFALYGIVYMILGWFK